MEDTQSYPLYNEERKQERIEDEVSNIRIDLFDPQRKDIPTDTERKLRELISDNIGRYVRCEFLIGTQTTVVREGILSQMGTSFILLYHEEEDTYESCDFYALKFMTFYRCREHSLKVRYPDRQRRR